MTDGLLTVQELAKKLRVPISWIYSQTRKRERNSMPVIRLGKYVRFDVDEVLHWLKENSARHT